MLGYIISDKDEINVEEHEIKSFNILHKTYLNIFVIQNNEVLYKNNIFDFACINGHVQVLEWFKNSGYEFKYDGSINIVSFNGHVQVLEWLKKSGYEFKYNKYAINCASYTGHVQILEWFKNSGYKLKYSKWAIDNALHNCNIKFLKFYSNNINIKKLIKWIKHIKHIFIKTVKFKTHNGYIKGYQKN